MVYCRKCGAKLEEDARFCYVCGMPVAPVAAIRPTAPKKGRPIYFIPVVILIAVLLTAVVISALFFLPFYPVHFNQTNRLAKSGVNNLSVDFQADVANVNIFLENIQGNTLLLNVTADGNVGILDDPDRAVNVTFNHEMANNSAVVISSVSRATRWPVLYNLNVNCDVYIDPSANLSLTFHSGFGNIIMDAKAKVTLHNLDLETATGNIDISLSKDVLVAGSISLKSTTGTVQFRMEEADVSEDSSVDLQSTTGLVNMDLTAAQSLSGNITVNARTTTGVVNLFMVIDNDVGARIDSDTDVGRINVDVQKFSGNQSPLQSNNYPARSNFLVKLVTTTGSININAAYGCSTVLS